MDKITQTSNGVILDIRAKPASGGFSVKLGQDGTITISTKSPPEGNKANMEIVKGLMKMLRRNVRIVRGLQSKHKEIFVDGATSQEVATLLGRR